MKFRKIGITSSMAKKLTALIKNPPRKIIESAEFENADDVHHILYTTIIAAAKYNDFQTAFPHLLNYLSDHFNVLSRYDMGRLFHIKGFLAWRLDGSIYSATVSLNKSIKILSEENTSQAHGYLATRSKLYANPPS